MKKSSVKSTQGRHGFWNLHVQNISKYELKIDRLKWNQFKFKVTLLLVAKYENK